MPDERSPETNGTPANGTPTNGTPANGTPTNGERWPSSLFCFHAQSILLLFAIVLGCYGMYFTRIADKPFLNIDGFKVGQWNALLFSVGLLWYLLSLLREAKHNPIGVKTFREGIFEGVKMVALSLFFAAIHPVFITPNVALNLAYMPVFFTVCLVLNMRCMGLTSMNIITGMLNGFIIHFTWVFPFYYGSLLSR